jgi:hypothetical protein
MPRQAEYHSIRSLAKRLGKDEANIRRAIRDGAIDANDLERSAAAWAERANEAPPRAKPPTPGSPTAKSRERLEAARAEKEEILVKQLKGELVDRAGALRTVHGAMQIIRELLEGWPARQAAPIASKLGLDDPHKVENILAEEVHGLLMHAAGRMKVTL